MKATAVPANRPAVTAVPRLIGWVVVVSGCVVLLGWWLCLPMMFYAPFDLRAMKANAALGFVLAGSALVLLSMPGRWVGLAAQGCALALGGMALLTLIEYAGIWNVGIDECLCKDLVNRMAGENPGRMAPNTAVGFVLVAAALLLLSRTAGQRRRPLILSSLALLVVLIGLVAMLSYLAQFEMGYTWWNLTAIPIHTALLFVLLGGAVFIVAWQEAGLRWLISAAHTIGFGCGLLLLVVMAAYSHRSTMELVAAAVRVKHTHEVIGKLSELRSYLDESQSGVRGYLVTGDEAFLPLAVRAPLWIRQTLDGLHGLTQDNPRQQLRLTALEKLITEHLELAQQTIDFRRRQGFEAAAQMDATRRGKLLMDQIRAGLEALDAEEDRLLIIREALSDTITSETFALLPSGVLVSVVILIWGLLRLNGAMLARQHGADELAAERNLLRTLVDLLPALVFVKDRASRFLVANVACARHMGAASPQDLIGKTDADFYPPAEAASFLADEQNVLDGVAVVNKEQLSDRSDNLQQVLLTTKVPLRGNDGKIIGMVGVCLDITERKRAANFLRLVVNSIPDFVFWKDRNSVYLGCNNAFAQAAGVVNPESILGKTDYDLGWKKEEADFFVAVDQRVMASNQAEYHIIEPQLQAGGKQAWLETCKVPLHDEKGQVIGLLGTYLDITERKQAEDEIRQLNTTLDHRVSERTAQLEMAVKELDSFSYSVSHDLRAPLRAVDGFARILSDDHARQLDDEGRRMLEVIRSETLRMAKLIDDLLAFSRLGRQQIEQIAIDMNALAQTVFDEMAALEPDRILRLDLHSLPPAHGTQAMIRQVWVNLIGNAIKFTKEREVGEIEIGVQDGEAGEQIYYVKDNGAGFDMLYANKLFGVFQRLHTQHDFPGTGVGLALVERIVQRHGGRVWAEAQVHHGATFYFTLPHNNHENTA